MNRKEVFIENKSKVEQSLHFIASSISNFCEVVATSVVFNRFDVEPTRGVVVFLTQYFLSEHVLCRGISFYLKLYSMDILFFSFGHNVNGFLCAAIINTGKLASGKTCIQFQFRAS